MNIVPLSKLDIELLTSWWELYEYLKNPFLKYIKLSMPGNVVDNSVNVPVFTVVYPSQQY